MEEKDPADRCCGACLSRSHHFAVILGAFVLDMFAL
jgi:hypothetical protein